MPEDSALTAGLTKMMDEGLKNRFAGNRPKKDQEPFPPTWIPVNVDDALQAQVLRIFDTKYGAAYIVVDVEGNQWTLPKNVTVVQELTKHKVGIGDVVLLIFKGEKPSKDPTHKPMKNIAVVVVSKDAFEASGLPKFPAPKPVQVRPKSSQTPAPSSSPIPNQPAPATAAPVAESTSEPGKDQAEMLQGFVARMADMASKVGGFKRDTFEKLLRSSFKNITVEDAVFASAGVLRIDPQSGKIVRAE